MNEDLYEKTLLEKRNNLIVFHGNNLNPLPEELFQSIDKLYNKFGKQIYKKINSHDDYNVMWYLLYEDGSYTYDDCCFDSDYYTLYPYNATIGLTKYYDYEANKEIFCCLMTKGNIDLEFITSDNRFKCEMTLELNEFYEKWKNYKINYPMKFNEPYKENKQTKINNLINALNIGTCEVCIYREQCYNGPCLLSKEHIETIEIPKHEQYKINLHILEPCNYKCRHCFAHFDNNKILKLNKWKHIVDNCAAAIWTNTFNIAGGEPLLYNDLTKLIKYIYNKGHQVSIITNGFLMTEEWIKNNSPYLETIGFSIDSFIPETLLLMGRKTNKNEYLSREKFIKLCEWIKQYNPKCKIKVNTVVTSLNYQENLLSTLKLVNLDRWKILKMKIFKMIILIIQIYQ